MNRRVALYITLSTVLLLMAGSAAAQSDDRTRVFNAPVDRVWVVARSTLKGLGWGVDKEDRDVGWIRTDSRRLEGEDYGVAYIPRGPSTAYASSSRPRMAAEPP